VSVLVCGCVCSEICRCLGGAELYYAGGDVGYDVPTSHVYVQGEIWYEMLDTMLKHSNPHPIKFIFLTI
jgi:hypothetical protein